ncbi:MAG TPA: hypothetical protein VIU61_12725 [Kofleriaceae bacterium]
MRMIWVLALAACGGDSPGLDPPACGIGEMRYVFEFSDATGEDGGEGSLSISNHAFINKISDGPGTLDIGGSLDTAHVHLEFEKLLTSSNSVPVRGFVTIDADLDFGHCETAGLSGRFSELDSDDGWAFSLVGLHRAPYCDTAELDGSFAACYRRTSR